MPYVVDFKSVSTIGLESSPVGEALAGLRANEGRYESGLSVNVMYSIQDGGKRAVGFKLAEGMDIPEELETSFKFARQKSKLAGVIRGSYFVIKGEY
jgi:hypothetical protein